MNFLKLRNHASRPPLLEADLLPDPFQQFGIWMQEAVAAKLPEPTAMTLATADAKGRPSARTVLLKAFDERGFVFYTNYGSRKARDLAENVAVALLFHWTVLERQVRIEGRAERVSREESDAYFHSRPRGSQLGAWSSRQSEPIANREALEASVREVAARYAGQSVPLPDFWGGYRVTPSLIEFWQGGAHRLHDRLCYTLSEGGWRIERLSP